jgi:hypothetical protein
MNNSYSNIEISEKNNLNSNVQLFIKKMCNLCLNTNFYQFINLSNKLVDSLIDICIKNKIDYFIENHVSFSSIKSNFKLELENYLLECAKYIYPFIALNITNVFLDNLQNTNSSDYWNSIINILSKKSCTKNKVSFNPTATEYTYINEESNNKKSKKKSKPIKILLLESDNENQKEITVEQKISIYMKIIFTDKIHIDNLSHKLCCMCSVLNEPNIEYDIYDPYKK